MSGSDAWAVGRFDNASNFDNPLILHWNGRSWGRARAPARASSLEELLAVAASSAARAWAVGLGPCVGGGVDCPSHSLALRWNGTRWAAVGSPSVSDSRDQNILTGVAVASGGGCVGGGQLLPRRRRHARPGAAAALDRDDLAQGLTPPTVSGLPAGFAARCGALGWSGPRHPVGLVGELNRWEQQSTSTPRPGTQTRQVRSRPPSTPSRSETRNARSAMTTPTAVKDTGNSIPSRHWGLQSDLASSPPGLPKQRWIRFLPPSASAPST